ncbi:MAG: hypothetical protein LBC65_05140, partial [Oscillospiraceae bacterium]|nr:hypothetical protein [Oscillospiraceae bacterium]
MASVTPLRITGMSSGIDTDGIIQSMLKIQQLKVDREIRSRINLQWKQDGLKQINADITEFRNTYLSTLSSKNVFSSATFNTRTVSAVGSNSGAISVTAGADAALGTFTINAVTSLASGANVKSTGGTVSAVSSDGQGLRDLGLDKTLGQLNWSRSAGLTGGSLTVNGGAAITYDSDTTLKSLTEQFDMAGYTLSISGDKFTLTANDGGAVDVTADTGNLTTLLGFASEHATKGVTGGMLTQSSDRATITGATLLTDIAGTGTG